MNIFNVTNSHLKFLYFFTYFFNKEFDSSWLMLSLDIFLFLSESKSQNISEQVLSAELLDWVCCKERFSFNLSYICMPHDCCFINTILLGDYVLSLS